MIGGFALIATPAEYGVTGVQTFIVNHNGIVYQKDLGPDSLALAKQITVQPRQNLDPHERRVGEVGIPPGVRATDDDAALRRSGTAPTVRVLSAATRSCPYREGDLARSARAHRR